LNGLHDFVVQLVGGMRASINYAGIKSMENIRTETKLVHITNTGVVKSHSHDVIITKEAQKYQLTQD
jgi:IMP dehydrogenase